jgi:hypothetical protein
MEKISTFREKVDIILSIRGIKIKEIEKSLGVDGTFYKAYNENREPRKELLAEFLRKFHVKESWWKSPKGSNEAAVFEENPTSDSKSTGSKETPDGLFQEILEGNSEYVVIPRTALQGNYRLIAIEILEADIKQKESNIRESERSQSIIDRLLDANEKLIAKIAQLESQTQQQPVHTVSKVVS